MTPDNPYGPFDAGGGDTIKCPYCAEPDFDAPGLKSHLLAGDCEVWNSTETLTRVFSSAQETSAAPSPSVLERLVTVCDACETAACWQGSFMCDSAEMAGIKNLTVRDLHEKPRGENAEYWFKDGDGKTDKTLLEIYQRLTSQNR